MAWSKKYGISQNHLYAFLNTSNIQPLYLYTKLMHIFSQIGNNINYASTIILPLLCLFVANYATKLVLLSMTFAKLQQTS